MADPKSTASSIKRFRAGASSRLTESLLSSSGKVAGVGVATALLTLGFTIWFGFGLRHQSEVGAPLARSAAVLNASINQSLAALRGWVAYGDAESRAERAQIWSQEIEPTFRQIDELAGSSSVPDTDARVSELGSKLRRLELVQWEIEDVAQTPGNWPATVAYERRLEPLRRSILTSLHSAIEQYTAGEERKPSISFLVQMAHFRSVFTQCDLAVASLIRSYNEAHEHTAEQKLNESRVLARQVEAGARLHTSGDLRHLLDFAVDEFIAYDVQVQEVMALRRAAGWNVVLLHYLEQAQPLVLEARAIAGALAEAQAQAMKESADRMTNASYLVIVMALTMGLLSAGSLFVSYRLNQQVHNVMARAKRLGQYEIEERIGKGGMGEVYLARHAMLRRPTAIKLLRAENAQDLRAQSRFQREVQLTCQLTHPNTIEIFDYGRTPEGIFYYAMEYLDGFTIEALVSLSGPVEPARVIHTLVQACGSLQEAHSLGLLHRDIKPSNIMLTTRGGAFDTVKILDFGLVKDLAGDDADHESAHDVILGTPMYLAPEVILSPESGSPKADLYALGAVGYYMLSGTTVFPAEEVSQILASQINDVVPFPSERLGRALPRDLEYVIMSCLAKDPAERPESAMKLAEMLRACDCGTWSVDDARFWWEEYGEAARNEIAIDDTRGSALRSELQVVVQDSRS